MEFIMGEVVQLPLYGDVLKEHTEYSSGTACRNLDGCN